MIKNSMSLKAKISNIAKENNISAHILIHIFMLERFLERIAVSRYKNNFILKGGLLISSMIGIDNRNTMDMDATIRGFSLTAERLKPILETIIETDVGDNIKFDIVDFKPILKGDGYNGIRVLLKALFDGMNVNLQIDITTGDIVTYKEISYDYPLLLEDKIIHVWSYNLETILAEKYHSTIIRGITNTRIRDYYDMYILTTLKKDSISKKTLFDAINETAKHRNDYEFISNPMLVNDTFKVIATSKNLQHLWEKYQQEFAYAKDISYKQLIESIRYIKNLYFNERN